MTRKKLAGFTAVLAFVLLLSGCSATPNQITAQANGSTVTVALPAGLAEPESEAALQATDGLPLVGDYLMLRPSEITIDGEIPESGVQLQVTLPEKLPEGATATFAYFGPELQVWVPVPTQVDGSKVTATVHHLSLWTVVVSGFEAAAEWIGDAATAVGDGLAWWSTEGPGAWIYRQGGLALGLQAAAPTCEPGDLPGWVDQASISQLTGLPEDNQNVLRCVGPDPSDAQLLQVKAVINRSYSFDYKIADGVQAVNMQWSVLPGVSPESIEELAQIFGTSGVFLDPREALLGTSELAFSVSRQDVKQLAEGTPLIEFLPSWERRAALSYVYKFMLDYADDKSAALLGTFAAVHVCEMNQPDELTDKSEVGEWFGYFTGCLQQLDEDVLEDVFDEIAKEAAVAENPNTWQQFMSGDGQKALKLVRSMLKWVEAVNLGLSLIGYAAERDMQPSFVQVTAKAAPTWEDAAGTWCNKKFPDNCFTIAYPHMEAYDGRSVPWDILAPETLGECVFSMVENTQGGYGSAHNWMPSLTYCPAGAPTPYGVKTDSRYGGTTQDLFDFAASSGDDDSEERVFRSGTPYFRQ